MIIAISSGHNKIIIPKLVALHIISTIDIHRVYNNIIAIILFIQGAIKCGYNNNDFIFNIRNYSKFISISIINIGIMATSIKFIKKGYFKRINRIIIIYRFMHIIILFQSSRHPPNEFTNIGMGSIVFIAIFKYGKIFRFVESNIILFNQRSNFMGTLKSNKFFNLFDIIIAINTLSIRREDF